MSDQQEPTDNEQSKSQTEDLITSSLSQNVERMKRTFGSSTDLVIREMGLGPNHDVLVAIVYLDGLVDSLAVHQLLDSIVDHVNQRVAINIRFEGASVEELRNSFAITVGGVSTESDWSKMISQMLSGNTVVMIDGYQHALSVSTIGWEHRNVSEPVSQSVIRGPQDAFTEVIRTNTALIRRRVKNPNLWLETKEIGRMTKTDVAIMFIKGLAPEEIVDEVRHRIDQIDIDGVLEGNYIEEFIQDTTWTVFPMVNNTERPDIVAAALLEGRIAILVDGTPFVLLVPALFTQFLQSPEDYYHSTDFGFVRMLRFVAVFISLLAPAFYIALTTYHQEMIPTVLLISIAAQREGVPFPAFVEATMMELTFELLREAGIRMPRAIGSAISIVGALVLGQAAVDAGIISPAMVIIVAITAISGFISPSIEFSYSIRLIRFIFMALAATFGIFGMLVGFIGLVLHLCHLSSFNIPYMSPIAPFNAGDQRDTFVRVPWWAMLTRANLFPLRNKKRQQVMDRPWFVESKLKPNPEGNGGEGG
ncbi:spore germination protein [Paenibacillus guangzhouensis]|uniref:spore germination protein n=1 Tax=Paenibacillus guangzhouensis TaxID=1473112 RepID=UPI001D1236C7|nr:spore germination protein [Paenibacillus guangzhouensis]